MPRSARRALCLSAVLASAGGGAPVEAQIYTRTNANGVVEATNVPDDPGFRLTYPGKGTLIHSRGFRRSYRGEYDQHINDAASAFNVAPALVHAIIQTESEYDAQAVSSKGAQGLMQLMPATGRRFGVSDAFEPRQNIFGGVQYLRFLLDLFQGDVALAAAGYNAGENAVLRYRGVPPYRETRNYVQKVQALFGGGAAGLRSTSSGGGAQWFAARPRGETPAATGQVSQTPVTGFAPSRGRLAVSRSARTALRPEPARPRVFYKWRDERGTWHVAEAPPGEGITYSMIRALD